MTIILSFERRFLGCLSTKNSLSNTCSKSIRVQIRRCSGLRFMRSSYWLQQSILSACLNSRLITRELFWEDREAFATRNMRHDVHSRTRHGVTRKHGIVLGITAIFLLNHLLVYKVFSVYLFLIFFSLNNFLSLACYYGSREVIIP